MSEKPTCFSVEESLEVVWEALAQYRENCIPEGFGEGKYDKEWSDICTAMAWIEEELKCPAIV